MASQSKAHSRLHQLRLQRRQGVNTAAQADIDVVPASTSPEDPSPVQPAKRAPSTGLCTGVNCDNTGGPNLTVPIVLAVVIPIVIALAVLLYLHRRGVKKLRAEDARDPHRSLDFGLGDAPAGKGKKGKKGGPEMAQGGVTEKSMHRPHGLSMDMDLGNPYMLPPEIHHSRESLHSLSRSLGPAANDPYGPVSFVESPSALGHRRGEDNESTRTGSTGRGFRQDGMNRGLLHNASRSPHSDPPMSPSIVELPNPEVNPSPIATQPSMPLPTAISRKDIPQSPAAPFSSAELDANPRQSTASHDVSVIRHSNNYLASFVRSREASMDGRSGATSPDMQPTVSSPPPDRLESPPPRGQSKASPLPQISIEDEFPGSIDMQNGEIVVPPPPGAASRSAGGTGRTPDIASPGTDATTPFYTPQEEEHHENPMEHGLVVPGYDMEQAGNRLSIGRPLPPEDPTDTAEQRANRIRSFYKEYFNDTEAYAYAPTGNDYHEDYNSEFLGDATIFDPNSGQFVVAQAPYAEPVTRRAMTPPPRGPPRFRGAKGPGSRGSNPGPGGPRGRAFSTVSAGGRMPRGPQKRLPPPKALQTLPTPHLLKEDAFNLTIDFAPPPKFKDQAAGRPASPFSESRPYSPGMVASPLKSAFMDLPSMPSPHLLRRSGTFTALDFAPPPKIRDRNDASSDAGSIRSGRSNRSAMTTRNNIRAGAYRLSRVPIDLVGSRDDFAQSLKPTWKVGSN